MVPVFVNKILLGHSHAHLVMHGLWLLVHYTCRNEKLWQRPYDLQHLKYSFSGLLRNSLWTPYTNCGPSRKNQKHLQGMPGQQASEPLLCPKPCQVLGRLGGTCRLPCSLDTLAAHRQQCGSALLLESTGESIDAEMQEKEKQWKAEMV